MRKTSRAGGEARDDCRRGGGVCKRGARARTHYVRDWRAIDEKSEEARQGGLRAFRLSVSRFQRRERIHGRIEGAVERPRQEIVLNSLRLPDARCELLNYFLTRSFNSPFNSS